MWKTSGPTLKSSATNKLHLDDIDALRSEPTSAKAQACKTKIVQAIIKDKVAWKELQKEMQGTNLHTNVGLSIMLNGEVLEKIGLKLVEKQNEEAKVNNANEETPSKLSDKFSKRGSGSFDSIKTTMKSLEQTDDFMPNFKGILKFCRGSATVTSSFSELGFEKTGMIARKNSICPARSMSINPYQQSAGSSALASAQSNLPGRKSSSPVVEGRAQRVAPKAVDEAVYSSDHIRTVLQNAVAAVDTQRLEKRLTEGASRSAELRNDDVNFKEDDEVGMVVPKGMVNVAFSATSQSNSMGDRRKDSSKGDHRLRHGSNIILQNFSEMNGQKGMTTNSQCLRVRKLERKMIKPKRCQATAA